MMEHIAEARGDAKLPLLAEHGPRCWGAILETHRDRNGKSIGRCDRCGQRFETSERNIDGADVQTLQEI